MIVKCTKTGKILATEEEMREHADAFGVAAFEEINPDTTKIWMNPMSGKYCFSANEMDVYCRRTGEMQSSFVEMSVTDFLRVRSEKQVTRANDIVVEKYANQKFLTVLVELKGHSVLPAEKALWFTRNESVAAAEQWLSVHSKDADFLTPLRPSESDITEHGGVASLPSSDQIQVPLEEFINSTFLSELESMGFSRPLSIRALYKTDNAGTAPAVEWLSVESNLSDDSPLPEFMSVPKPRQKLSKEEAQEAAIVLQKKLRDQRLEREAAEVKEKEKQRIVQTKLQLEQQVVLEEAQRKRDIAERERLKREAEQHRIEVANKLKQDYIERFGFAPEEENIKKVPQNPKERVLHFLNQLKKNNPSEVTKNCLSLLRVYLSNIEKDSGEKKFHKIRYVLRYMFCEKFFS